MLVPLGQSYGAVLLKFKSAVDVTILVAMVVNGGVSGSEFLRGINIPEPGHRALSTSKRLVCVFDPVIELLPKFLKFFSPADAQYNAASWLRCASRHPA